MVNFEQSSKDETLYSKGRNKSLGRKQCPRWILNQNWSRTVNLTYNISKSSVEPRQMAGSATSVIEAFKGVLLQNRLNYFGKDVIGEYWGAFLGANL